MKSLRTSGGVSIRFKSFEAWLSHSGGEMNRNSRHVTHPLGILGDPQHGEEYLYEPSASGQSLADRLVQPFAKAPSGYTAELGGQGMSAQRR